MSHRSPKLRPLPPPPAPLHPFDAHFGTDTGGLIPAPDLRTGAPADRFVTAYYAVAPSILKGLLELWQHQTSPPLPLERYTFVDIGCGKGRALLLAATNPFAEVVGIELNPGLAAIARRNLALVASRAELLAPCRILEADALTTPFPPGPLVVFLFHPFEAPALRRLLRALEALGSDRQHRIDLLYVNAEHAAVLDHHPALTRLWQGRLPMSTEDHLADLAEIATQLEYGSTGDELCAIYRLTGRQHESPSFGSEHRTSALSLPVRN